MRRTLVLNIFIQLKAATQHGSTCCRINIPEPMLPNDIPMNACLTAVRDCDARGDAVRTNAGIMQVSIADHWLHNLEE